MPQSEQFQFQFHEWWRWWVLMVAHNKYKYQNEWRKKTPEVYDDGTSDEGSSFNETASQMNERSLPWALVEHFHSIKVYLVRISDKKWFYFILFTMSETYNIRFYLPHSLAHRCRSYFAVHFPYIQLLSHLLYAVFTLSSPSILLFFL